MEPVLGGIEPGLLWKHFDELRKIPRCSKHEEKAARYVVGVARRLELEYEVDAVGNVVMRKPATSGYEGSPTVVLQSHLDMVCEKNKDVDHDFEKDPIEVVRDGDYLHARGTTLGADNGVGVSAALAVLEDLRAVHGPLELLFTVDEEEGMTGAYGLGEGSVRGRQMINLDTEDPHSIYVGCAGGENMLIHLPVSWERASGAVLSASLGGLKGGHSGVDIHLERGNAVKLLGRVLWEANEEVSLRLAAIGGGSKHNAIPREAEAVVIVSEDDVKAIGSRIKKSEAVLRAEYKKIDPGLRVGVEVVPAPLPDRVITIEGSKRVLDLMRALPNGIGRWSPEIEDLVETSDNLSILETGDDIFFLVSVRSSSESQLRSLADEVRAVARLAGAKVSAGNAYPGWQPDLDSKMLRACRSAYEELFGRQPALKAIHAGLETGIIGQKFPEMEMVSIGPRVKHPHSPDERVKISSVVEFYELLLRSLAKIAKMDPG